MQKPPPKDADLSRSFKKKELNIVTKGVKALKRWTWKANAAIVYDSAVDPFTHDGLFDKVMGRDTVGLVLL